jgi:hypothetical protein
MVVSIVIRKTRIADRQEWQRRLEEALPRIRAVLEAEPGFLSLQYLWRVDGDGHMAQVTTWREWEDCRRHIWEGGAATVAALEDRALPTAPHPEGTWVRHTFEVAITVP